MRKHLISSSIATRKNPSKFCAFGTLSRIGKTHLDSNPVGGRERAPDGLLDLFHVTAQGVIAGANMILVDFHPAPAKALVDGPQALTLEELPIYLEDIAIAREAYEKRRALAAKSRKD